MKEDIDMENLKNELNDVKSPFVVPEGYFEAMRERASRLPDVLAERERRLRRILIPVLSTAASVAIVVMGVLVYGGRTAAPSLYSENVGDSMTCDEIIDYLVYTGASVEDVNAAGYDNF